MCIQMIGIAKSRELCIEERIREFEKELSHHNELKRKRWMFFRVLHTSYRVYLPSVICCFFSLLLSIKQLFGLLETFMTMIKIKTISISFYGTIYKLFVSVCVITFDPNLHLFKEKNEKAGGGEYRSLFFFLHREFSC